MEWKIGETFENNGDWYQCVRSINYTCKECDLHLQCKASELEFPFGVCLESERRDNTQVVFKKLEKVGEPYEYFIQGSGIIIVQEYVLAHLSYSFDDDKHVFVLDCQNGRVAIEIKQNKEDMEEKRIQLSQEEYDYIKKQIGIVILPGNIADDVDDDKLATDIMNLFTIVDDTKHSNSEKIGENLKPFSLELAKAGKPVCTRSGIKARIICFDRRYQAYEDKMNYPIVALLDNNGNGNEGVYTYTEEGLSTSGETNDDDLMMLPEKKEGWVNVYGSKDHIFQSEEEAKAHNDDFENYITTIKITL